MGDIKVVAWDVYGTIISSGGGKTSRESRTRPGALEALTVIKSRGINQCTCSDGNLGTLKKDLQEGGITWKDFFYDLYSTIPFEQKDFSYILEVCRLEPNNLLVIGDNEDLDLTLAREQGCQTFHVPEKYKHQENPLDVQGILKLL